MSIPKTVTFIHIVVAHSLPVLCVVSWRYGRRLLRTLYESSVAQSRHLRRPSAGAILTRIKKTRKLDFYVDKEMLKNKNNKQQKESSKALLHKVDTSAVQAPGQF